MKSIGQLIIVLSLIYSCTNTQSKDLSPYAYLPEDAEVQFKVRSSADFISNLERESIAYNLYPEHYDLVKEALDHLKPEGATYMSFLKNEKNQPLYILVLKTEIPAKKTDSIPNESKLDQTLESIDSLELNDSKLFLLDTGKYIVASNSKSELLTSASQTKDRSVLNVFTNSSEEAIVSASYKNDNSQLSNLLLTPTLSDLENQILLDFDFRSNGLTYNGILKYKDSIASLMECFKNTKPQSINTIKVIPDDASKVISLAFDDYRIFEDNRLRLVSQDSTPSVASRFLTYVSEIAKADDVLILYGLDIELIEEAIEEKTFTEEFRGVNLFSIKNTSLFDGRFDPFFNFEKINACAFYKDYAIFSKDVSKLKSLLSKALNNSTLNLLEAYKNLENQLSDEASVFVFQNTDGLSDTFDTDLNGYDANVVQLINEDNFAHVNGIIQKFKKRSKRGTVTESFSLELKTDAINAPQLVKNHVSGDYDIIVQDANNTINLIAGTGKLLWTKQIQGNILGDIQQIDMYKNGRLQLAFATKNRLYVVDRNGKDVAPFPLKFRDDITQPLSVFDYDNNRNYRLLVTQGHNLLMYDARGKGVSGFDYNLNKGKITSQPKHFRIASKDYIALKTENQLVILNRRGKERVSVNKKFTFSDNAIYNYKDKFTSTSRLGELLQVDTKGRVTITNLNLPENHYLTTTSKTLVSLYDNRLKIKSRTITLDYGDYTAPRIFYINNKIYVSLTDKEAKKVYLFDSQAKAIPNFPVYGTSSAVLKNIDDDSALELITMDGERKVLVYEIN